MTAGATDLFLEELSAWAENSAQDLDGNGDDAALLFDLARDYLGRSDLAELRPGELRKLLLEVYPRKITVRDPQDADAVIPTMREVCCFLRDTGRLPARRHAELVRELDDIEPRFADAVMDPANWGMARSFTQAMIADGIDIEDPDAMEGWIKEYNDGLAGERHSLTRDGEQSLLPLGLPADPGYGFDEDADDEGALELAPVRLAPPAELAAAARACPLLVSAQRLAEWLGPSRRLTATGALRLADARAIITEFGLATSTSDIGVAIDPEIVASVRRLELDQLQSARDFDPLERLWLIAQAAGLVEVDGRRASPGPLLEVLAPGSDCDRREQDAALLHAWSAAFLWLVHPDFPVPGGPLPSLLQGELLGMLTALYTADGPVELSGLADEAKSYLPGRLEPIMGKGENLVKNAVAALLGGPVAAGAAELTSGHVTLTPLGVWGVCQILRATGVLAPAIGDYAGSDAGDLLTAIARYDAVDGAAELAGWVQRREPAQAAADLAAAIKAGTPVQRMAGIDALAPLGALGRDAARSLLGEPGVGALAAMWLASVGEDPQVEISAEDTLWVLVEMGAAMLDAMPPVDAVQHLTADTTPADLAAQIAYLWTIDHPRTVDVLTALADHYQDRVVAKAARKAIFRARGRSAGNAVPSAPPRADKRPDRAGQRKRAKRKRRR